jgi:uncharacterized protein (DUF433 family)
VRLVANKTILHSSPPRQHRGCRSPWRPESRFSFLESHADEEDHASPNTPIASYGYSAEMLAVFDGVMRRCPSISRDPDIMDGQPCIAGTRVPVRAVLRVIEQYGSLDGAAKCYPHLTNEQIKDSLCFSQLVLELPSGIDETPSAS